MSVKTAPGVHTLRPAQGPRTSRNFVCMVALLLAGPLDQASSLAQSLAERSPTQMIVLQSGRVVQGIVTEAAGGYMVEFPTGSMFLPFDQVRFEAENLGDAYRKLRKSMPDLTAGNHIALARWCMSQHQYYSARTELKDALALEPNRREARELLVRLDRLTSGTTNSPELPRTRKRDEDGFAGLEAKALAGLSRATAKRYVTRIQPLLLNKCGNSGCHSAKHPTQFRLQRVPGHSRQISEQNLAMIVKYIDVDQPDKSPLLTEARGNHGERGRSLFFGRSGSSQLSDLHNWVRAYAAEERSNAGPSTTSFAASDAPPSKLGAAASIPDRNQAPPRAHTQPGARPLDSPQARGAALVERVLEEEARDAFDPDDFNRKFSRTQSIQTTSPTAPAGFNGRQPSTKVNQ